MEEKYKSGDIVFIKNAFYLYHRDKELFRNTGVEGNRRPFFLVEDIKDKNMYWAIPFSSKVDKYRNLIGMLNDKDKPNEENVNIDYASKFKDSVFTWINGKKGVALLANAIPILASDIEYRYTKKQINDDKEETVPVAIKSSEKNMIIDRFTNELKHEFYAGKGLGFLSSKTYNEVSHQSLVENMTTPGDIKEEIYEIVNKTAKHNSKSLLKEGKFFENEGTLYQLRWFEIDRTEEKTSVNAIVYNADLDILSLHTDWGKGRELEVTSTISMFNREDTLRNLKTINDTIKYISKQKQISNSRHRQRELD